VANQTPTPQHSSAPTSLSAPPAFVRDDPTQQRRNWEAGLPKFEVKIVARAKDGRKKTFAGGYADKDGTHVSAYAFRADGRQRTFRFTLAMVQRLMQNRDLDVELTSDVIDAMRKFLGPEANMPRPPKSVAETIKDLKAREKAIEDNDTEDDADDDEEAEGLAEVRQAPLLSSAGQREVIPVEENAEVKPSKK